MPKGFKRRGPPDPYANLPGEFKEAIAQSSPEEIEKRIATIRNNEAENLRNLREDIQVQEKKLEYDQLAAPYKFKQRTFRLSAKAALKKGNQPEFMEAVKAEAQNATELKTDSRVSSAKSELKAAKEQYTEATKANTLKERYCLMILSNKGKA